MKYTDTQHHAVHTDTNIALVSAAAGSGKTSVLAGRVARLVEGGADIGNMLVMTFTRAAAAEMKRRIAGVLTAAATRQNDKRLMEQSELTGSADISTFHSFCTGVVRENYNIAEVAPDYKIMNDVEASSLKNGVVRELFDILYEKGDSDFLRLVRRFTSRGDDSGLARALLKIYDTMMGRPQPFEWALQSANTDIRVYMARLRAEYEKLMTAGLADALALMMQAYSVSRNCGGKQAEADEAVLAGLEDMLDCARQNGVDAARDAFAGFKIPSLLPKASPELKEGASSLRSEARGNIKAFLNDTVYDDFTLHGKELTEHTREDVISMVHLIELFSKLYTAQKNRRNALDYEDLQHKALKVLEQDTGYGRKYTHIFVDEYQDTNPVQEEIIRRIHTGGNCLFMVGDMKQSIYKFRLADPEIFKKRAQALGGEDGCLIAMNDNFRSADGVIAAVNFVMDRIMSEELGGVRYGQGEVLVGNIEGGEAKILLCETDERAENYDGEEGEPLGSNDAQAKMIASSIDAVLKKDVRDRETGVMRRAECGDIAILMRSRSELAGKIKHELSMRGIPCVLSIKEARDVPEVELFVNLLRIIQNPGQDIPLLSVMRSFIGGFDEADFAAVRLVESDPSKPFHTAAETYRVQVEDELARRLDGFYGEMERLARWCEASALSDFIPHLAEHYDFYTYLMSVNGGATKKQSFDELLALMLGMVDTCGNSLYTLLKELGDIKKREGCYVRSEQAADGTDAVRIMTIHGSKGLEFPIVYVAGLNKKFNMADTRDDFLLHNSYGVTARYVDDAEMCTVDTMERRVVCRRIEEDNRSEELRMLYVAMTRARDRLYLCGCVNDVLAQNQKWDALCGRYNRAASMLDWIMAANAERQGIVVEYVKAESVAPAVSDFDYEALKQMTMEQAKPVDTIYIEKFTRVPAKVSVSAVKRASVSGVRSFLSPETDDGEIVGAQLGTLVHGMMERLVREVGGFDAIAEDMLKREIISGDEYEALLKNRGMAEGFMDSGIYRRMKKSDKLLLEQQFNMRVKARDIGYDSDEFMLVQGILDAAFMEGGKWVLLDYKSDRVTQATAQKAAQGYKIQIDLYARALAQITGTEAGERYLYFLRPGMEIEV